MFKFIGCGSAFNTDLGNNAAYIKQDNNFFLIDCGSVTFDRIKKNDLLNGVENIYILMTHTHPDHIGSLGDLIFYGYYMVGKLMECNVTIISPKDLNVDLILRSMGVEDKMYQLVDATDQIEIGSPDFNFKIQPIQVEHIPTLKSYAYIINYDKCITYFSGDANEIPQPILEQLNRGKFDYFYQDACRAEYEGNPHLSLSKLEQLVNQDVRKKVYCMHLDTGFDVKGANDLGFNVVNIDFGDNSK